MRHELHRAADRLDVRFARRQAVGEEDHVELGALGRLRDCDVMLDVDVRFLVCARMAP
jgi:hypothetical protein